MEYTNGGTAANVYFYTWKKSGSTYFWDSTGSSKVTAAFAVTNGANESVPFGAFGLTTYPPFAFVEAAINVTKLLQASGDACAGLSVKTLWINLVHQCHSLSCQKISTHSFL
jgi:hypothetical protein